MATRTDTVAGLCKAIQMPPGSYEDRLVSQEPVAIGLATEDTEVTERKRM
jgi:hypothetical protein